VLVDADNNSTDDEAADEATAIARGDRG